MPQQANVPVLPKVAGLILAGGKGQRMGGNKPFRKLAGRPLIAHVINAAARQCGPLMISSNEDASLFAQFNIPVVSDKPQAGQGPLGGILGGLLALPDDIDWLVTFPVDCPIIPEDMAARLLSAAQHADTQAAFARYVDRDHYLSSIWHRDSAPAIAKQLADDNRRVGAALRAMDAARGDFPASDHKIAPFTNVNSPEDLSVLNKMLSESVEGRKA